MKRTILELSNRFFVPVDTTIRNIKPLFLDFLFLCVTLFEIVLHKLGIAAGVTNDSRLMILSVLIVLALKRFLLHTGEHFVWKVDFAGIVL